MAIFSIFSHPLVIHAPDEGFPWIFVTATGIEKMMPYQSLKKCDDNVHSFDPVPAPDRQTDRQTDRRTDRQNW